MHIHLPTEFEKARKTMVFGSLPLMAQHSRIDGDRETHKRVMDRMEAVINDGRGEAKISRQDLKQVIADFSDTSQHYAEKGQMDLSSKAGKAMSLATQVYMNATNDRDVFRALPKGQILGEDLKSPKSSPTISMAQKR